MPLEVLTCKLLVIVTMSLVQGVTGQKDACGLLPGQSTSLCDCLKNRRVDCSGRKLDSVPDYIPADTRELLLNNNNIATIRTGAFDNLYNLKTLNLNDNSINLIQPNAFRHLFHVEELSLDNNEMTEVTSSSFEHLSNLRTISLQNNHVRTIHHNTFYFKKHLRSIILDRNVLECGCEEKGLKEWVKQKGPVLFLAGALCQNFANTSLLSIPKAEFGQCPEFGNQTCFSCQSQSSSDCQKRETQCSSSKNACETLVIVDINGDVQMTKRCVSEQECAERLLENSKQCRAGAFPTRCRYCCTGKLCNKNVDYEVSADVSVSSTVSPTVSPSTTTQSKPAKVCFLKLAGMVPGLKEHTNRITREQCADKCLSDWACLAYQYVLTIEGSCYLIKGWDDMMRYVDSPQDDCLCELYLKSVDCDKEKTTKLISSTPASTKTTPVLTQPVKTSIKTPHSKTESSQVTHAQSVAMTTETPETPSSVTETTEKDVISTTQPIKTTELVSSTPASSVHMRTSEGSSVTTRTESGPASQSSTASEMGTVTSTVSTTLSDVKTETVTGSTVISKGTDAFTSSHTVDQSMSTLTSEGESTDDETSVPTIRFSTVQSEMPPSTVVKTTRTSSVVTNPLETTVTADTKMTDVASTDQHSVTTKSPVEETRSSRVIVPVTGEMSSTVSLKTADQTGSSSQFSDVTSTPSVFKTQTSVSRTSQNIFSGSSSLPVTSSTLSSVPTTSSASSSVPTTSFASSSVAVTSSTSDVPVTSSVSSAIPVDNSTYDVPVNRSTSPSVPITRATSSSVPIKSTTSSDVPVTSSTSPIPITSPVSSPKPMTSPTSSPIPVTSSTSSNVPVTSTMPSPVPMTSTPSFSEAVSSSTLSSIPATSFTTDSHEITDAGETSRKTPHTQDSTTPQIVSMQPSSPSPTTTEQTEASTTQTATTASTLVQSSDSTSSKSDITVRTSSQIDSSSTRESTTLNTSEETEISLTTESVNPTSRFSNGPIQTTLSETKSQTSQELTTPSTLKQTTDVMTQESPDPTAASTTEESTAVISVAHTEGLTTPEVTEAITPKKTGQLSTQESRKTSISSPSETSTKESTMRQTETVSSPEMTSPRVTPKQTEQISTQESLKTSTLSSIESSTRETTLRQTETVTSPEKTSEGSSPGVTPKQTEKISTQESLKTSTLSSIESSTRESTLRWTETVTSPEMTTASTLKQTGVFTSQTSTEASTLRQTETSSHKNTETNALTSRPDSSAAGQTDGLTSQETTQSESTDVIDSTTVTQKRTEASTVSSKATSSSDKSSVTHSTEPARETTESQFSQATSTQQAYRNVTHTTSYDSSTADYATPSSIDTTSLNPDINSTVVSMTTEGQMFRYQVTFKLMRDFTPALSNPLTPQYKSLASELYRKLTIATAHEPEITSVAIQGFSAGSIACEASVLTRSSTRSWYDMRDLVHKTIAVAMETGKLQLDLVPGSMRLEGEFIACFESRQGYVKGKLDPIPEISLEQCKDRCRQAAQCAGIDYMLNSTDCYLATAEEIEQGWEYSLDCECTHFRKNLKCVPALPVSCPSEVTRNSKGRMIWPITTAGSTADVPCPTPGKTGGMASRQCKLVTSGAGVWLEPDTSACANQTQRSKDLEKLSEVMVTTENVALISRELSSLTSVPSELGAYDVTNAATVFNSVIQSPGLKIYPDSASQLINSVSDLLNVDAENLMVSEKTAGSASSIVMNIESLAVMLNTKQARSTFVASNLAVAAIQLAPSVHGDLKFSSRADVNQTDLSEKDMILSAGDSSSADSTVSIQLPKQTLEVAADQITGVGMVQFTVYQSDQFFRVMNDNKSMSAIHLPAPSSNTSLFGLNSKVISARVGNLSLHNLSHPVVLSFKSIYSQAVSPRCVYWDFTVNGGRGGWSDSGCRVVSAEGSLTTQCECDHLTNFALLMDVYGTGHSIDEGNKLALSIISYVGCGISLVALSLALVTYLSHRKLRKDNPSKLLIQLCFALFFMLVTFLFCTFPFVRNNVIACKIVAALMHYFLLAAFTWMAVQAFYMYLALVKVFQTYYAKFILKCCLVGWGVPVLIVVLTVAISRDNYGHIGGELCWLNRYAFFGAAVAPVVLILMLNFLAFVMVIKQLRQMAERKLDKTKQITTMSQLRGAFSVMILLGLTWTFAIFAIDDASLVFQYLFAIFNSLQGLFIFVFYCAMKPEVQRTWMRVLPCCPTPQTTTTRSGSRGGTASTPVGSGTKKKFSLSLSWNQKKAAISSPVQPDKKMEFLSIERINSEVYSTAL